MNSFLKQSALNIFENHALSDLKDVTVILPSRRAVHFFKKELALLSKKAFLAPTIISIDDFIIQLSRLSVVSKLDLHFRVFDLFKELDKELTFEKYSTWAPILIKDFENIDLAMVKEVHLLFKYMSESDAISRWNLEENHEFTENAYAYFNFFEKIAVVYDKLRTNLLDNALCYKGLAYRTVAENLQILLTPDKQKFYFVGLNALSNAEEQIVKSMVLNYKAVCFWDTDEYYINSNNKAGKKLRYYRSTGKFGVWNTPSTFLQKAKKEINIIAIQNDVLQTKYVLKSITDNPEKRQVVVILDENQFKPLIFSLPAVSKNFNISRGIAVTSTKFYGVIELFNEIHQELVNSNKIQVSSFLKILDHEILGGVIKNELTEEEFEKIKNVIKNSKALFINNKWLKDNGFDCLTINYFFNASTQSQFNFFENLILLCDTIVLFLENIESEELVYVNIILSKILFFRDLSKKRDDISVKDIFLLLKQDLQVENIPFAANPDAKIQVMSMLETRCLDFETVTILSLNEGNLPSSQKSQSFIPNDAAKIFGLPLYTDQDAIMAYHFFRLIQRAETVNLLYLLQNNGGVGTMEKSRFIMQIEQELLNYNPNIAINYPKVKFSKEFKDVENTSFIIKDEQYFKKVKHYLINKGFYPSHLNDFFECTLRFYWKRIDKVSKIEEPKENFQPDVFGNILHYTLELIDKQFLEASKNIEKEDLEFIKANISTYINQILEELFNSFEIEIGLNSVLKSLIINLLEDYFDNEIMNYKFPINVIGNELHLTSNIKVSSENEEIDVKLSGIIDRIDLQGEIINLVDYKSGKVEIKDIETNSENYFDEFQNPQKPKLRQLLTYKYLLENGKPSSDNKIKEMPSGKIIIPKIISFRNLKENLALSPEKLINSSIEIPKAISSITNSLLDINQSITQTSDIKNCTFCDFKTVCNRE